MPEGSEQELENMIQVDKEMMLFALQSTLENAEDETIRKEEYHFKLVTYTGFEQQYGCLTDVTLTPDLTEMAMGKLTACFEAVEEGLMTEDDYFFELISPFFFYTSGKYNQTDQLLTTMSALSKISNFQDEENVEENIFIAFPVLSGPCDLETSLIKERSTSKDPIYQKTRIRDKKIDFTSKEMIQVELNQLHHVFGKRSVGGNTIYIWMVCMLLYIRIFFTKVLKKNRSIRSQILQSSAGRERYAILRGWRFFLGWADVNRSGRKIQRGIC
ncbi:uncharacterized protein LOC135153937 [Lytechinus pictus]|uniref:uncharacterized protein LOC135153937 n=1 Tax=Lytechinus pictus TaxID=7653 RepID=UPI0030B9EC99